MPRPLAASTVAAAGTPLPRPASSTATSPDCPLDAVVPANLPTPRCLNPYGPSEPRLSPTLLLASPRSHARASPRGHRRGPARLSRIATVSLVPRARPHRACQHHVARRPRSPRTPVAYSGAHRALFPARTAVPVRRTSCSPGSLPFHALARPRPCVARTYACAPASPRLRSPSPTASGRACAAPAPLLAPLTSHFSPL
nr:protein IQ-DOMAIN 14-like [Aegilops tauschii subsp. strangulata]